MQGLSYSEFGKPSQVLAVQELSKPEPAAGEVRLRMILSPIHNHDVLTVSGQYGYKPPLPAGAGSEGVGIVDALGEGVQGVSVGQRVVASGLKGVWAEYAIAKGASCVPMPESIDDETAAQLIAMPLSALTLLEFTGIREGQWLIQNAANGAVGKVLAQLAKPRGIHVINLVRRADAVEELKELGIENVIATDAPNWTEAVTSLTGTSPIAVAIDGVGGDASGDLLSLLGEGGQLISFGVMSGEKMRISAGDVIFKQAVVKGFWLAKLMETMSREDAGRMIGELVTRAAKGELKLQVDAVFPLAEAAKAVDAAVERGRKGKVLLRLS